MCMCMCMCSLFVKTCFLFCVAIKLAPVTGSNPKTAIFLVHPRLAVPQTKPNMQIGQFCVGRGGAGCWKAQVFSRSNFSKQKQTQRQKMRYFRPLRSTVLVLLSVCAANFHKPQVTMQRDSRSCCDCITTHFPSPAKKNPNFMHEFFLNSFFFPHATNTAAQIEISAN